MIRRPRITGIALALLAATYLSACGGGEPTGTTATVVASVEVSPQTVTLSALGDTRDFTAVAKDANGNTIGSQTFTWTSSATGVVTVAASGTATAVGNGTATISATTAGISGSASLTVSQTPATGVEVTPALDTLKALGETLQLSAAAEDANGHAIAAASFTWSSSDENVATVDGGLVTAVGPGQATITATAGGVPGDAVLIVEVFAMLSAGGSHTCGVTTSEVAYCWGLNNRGQLGSSTTQSCVNNWPCSTIPAPVTDALSFAALSAGSSHTCGVTTGGMAYCWGNNSNGQLGDGTTTDRTVSVAVAGELGFVSLSAGALHTCGVTTDGSAYCWGDNSFGQLGAGNWGLWGQMPWPVAVLGGHSFSALSAGGWHTCALTTGGVAYCWGSDSGSQLGRGDTGGPQHSDTPVAVLGGLSFATLSAGFSHTCGVTTGGVAYCWGRNGSGQLGDGSTGGQSPTPVAVLGGHSFSALSAGRDHTCGVTTGGVAYCWGGNGSGQLGDGTGTDSNTPVAVLGGHSFGTLSALYLHTCAVTTGGVAYCWGTNSGGQLGDGTATDRFTPVRVVR